MTYVNNTSYTITLSANGQPFSPGKPLPPGKSTKTGSRLRYWGDGRHIQAFDQDGIVRFDKTISQEELKEMNFLIIIE